MNVINSIDTDARPASARRQITLDEWLKKGEELFGEDKDQWNFVCVSCGRVQSAAAARILKPDIDEGEPGYWLRNYLAANCEGRLNKDVGCDWSLGGLFQIHKVEVLEGDRRVPVLEFAGETAV